jgi:hypothetical protein
VSVVDTRGVLPVTLSYSCTLRLKLTMVLRRKRHGYLRMYTGADGKSVIEELSQDDPMLETLKTGTGCSLQVNDAFRIF